MNYSNEIKQVKTRLLDLSFISNTRKQAAALKNLQIAVNALERSMAGEKQLFFDFSEPKSGM